ncbi:hypothetical protein QTP88_022362 [Uroleucon formosanum]
MSAFELIDILNSLLNNLKNRKNEHFINTEMEIIIDSIEEEVNEDEYFNEFMAFINIFQDKFDDWTKNVISVEQKWVQIFNIFEEKDVNVSNLAMVVEFAFCLPCQTRQ